MVPVSNVLSSVSLQSLTQVRWGTAERFGFQLTHLLTDTEICQAYMPVLIKEYLIGVWRLNWLQSAQNGEGGGIYIVHFPASSLYK